MSNQISLRHYKYFLAVAKELHFRKAAEQLYVSQPALSRQIKNMEEELGIKLFDRHNRKVVLTEAGMFLKQELEASFRHLDEVIKHAKLLSKGIDGSIKLAYVGSAMHKLIPELLLRFREAKPKVLINLKEMDNRRQIQAILSQEIDIGFVRMERVPKGLELLPAYEETFSLVLPKNHWLDADIFKSMAQLKEEHFILFDASYSESYYEKVMQIFDDCGFSPNLSHSTVNASSIYRLVENNFGVAIVPSSLQYGYDLNVKFIELDQISQRTNIKIIWNSQSTNPVLTSLIQIIRKHPLT